MANEHPHHLMIMQQYLVRPCPGQCKTPKLCFFYHSALDRRRNPFSFSYKPSLCELAARGEACLLGDQCPESHTLPEILFHPLKYKTSWCATPNCSPAFCCEAHRGVDSLRRHSESLSAISKPAVKHLNLEVFKVHPCKLHTTHNPKLCEFYHSTKDRRRNSPHSVDLCTYADRETCPQGDACPSAHNRVEQLYHPEKYKTKFCTFYPHKLADCDYGSFCSFAHSERDIKVELLHAYPRTSEFYVRHFKTVWCPFTNQHDKGLCVYAHNWQDFRRKPQDFPYEPVLCPNWQVSTFISSYEEGGCENLLQCNKCHGWKEIEYHPHTYKTRACPAGHACSKAQDCPMLHSQFEGPLSEQNLNFKTFTPAPPKPSLSPTFKPEAFTPFVSNSVVFPGFKNANKAEEVRKVNSNSDNFALHRGVRKKLNAHAAPFQSVEVDERVQVFLNKHKLQDLSALLAGVKYEEIPYAHMPSEAKKKLNSAWQDEIDEINDAEELIMEDIAVFTGQKDSKRKDLTKYAFQSEDVSHLTVSFENPGALPQNLKCPITKRLMRNPCVFSIDGLTYERAAISNYIKHNFALEEANQLIDGLKPNLAIRLDILRRFE